MTTGSATRRRRIFAGLLATTVPAAAVAVLAGPPATGANDPCAASEIARTIGSTPAAPITAAGRFLPNAAMLADYGDAYKALRQTVPDEATQTESYRAVIEAMGGDPVTIRVLDWGGEKDIEAVQTAGLVPEVADLNPALGLRGIRLLLRQPTLLEPQLAAILRAAQAGPVRVLLVTLARGTEQLEKLRFDAVNPTFLLAISKPA